MKMLKITLDRDNVVGCVRLQTQRRLQANILCSMYDNATSLFDVSLIGAPAAGERCNACNIQPIRAHKAILAHASPHLCDLFTSQGYVDSNKSDYTIASIDHNSLCYIVKLIYTDNVELANDDRTAERVRGILIGAKYLIMKDLADACETFLARSDHVDVNNCIDVFQFALKYNCTKILNVVCAFAAENLLAVSQSRKFLSLSRDECAKFLLSDPVAVAASADSRCRAAIAWLNHESPSRAESAECIMSMAPLDAAGVSPHTLLLASESAVIRPTIKEVCLTLIDAFASTVRKHQTDSQLEAENKKFNVSESLGEAWYVIGGQRHGTDFYRYDVARRQWSTLPNLPWERYWEGVCAVGKRLIVMGGRKNDVPSADIDEFDTLTQMWSTTSTAKFDSEREHVAVTADTKHAYALGGLQSYNSKRKFHNYFTAATDSVFNAGAVFDSVDRYSTAETRTISKLASMKMTRFMATAVCKNDDMLFVVGGETGDSYAERYACHAIDKYEHDFNTWSTVATLKNRYRVLAAAFLRDDLYMVGNCAVQGSVVEILDTCTGKLRIAPRFTRCRRGCSVVSLDNNIVCALGGQYSVMVDCSGVRDVVLSSVESLDVREGKWSVGTIVPDMPKANAHFGLARVPP